MKLSVHLFGFIRLNKRTAYCLADPEADNTVSINGDTIEATKALKELIADPR